MRACAEPAWVVMRDEIQLRQHDCYRERISRRLNGAFLRHYGQPAVNFLAIRYGLAFRQAGKGEVISRTRSRRWSSIGDIYALNNNVVTLCVFNPVENRRFILRICIV